MTSSKLDFKWDYSAINGIENRFRQGLVKMGYEVANKARDRAPYKTGALSNSIRVTTLGSRDDVYVVAGGSSFGKNIPYARIHELGGYTGRGYSVYIRPKHYLSNSLAEVVNGNWSQYFKGVA